MRSGEPARWPQMMRHRSRTWSAEMIVDRARKCRRQRAAGGGRASSTIFNNHLSVSACQLYLGIWLDRVDQTEKEAAIVWLKYASRYFRARDPAHRSAPVLGGVVVFRGGGAQVPPLPPPGE